MRILLLLAGIGLTVNAWADLEFVKIHSTPSICELRHVGYEEDQDTDVIAKGRLIDAAVPGCLVKMAKPDFDALYQFCALSSILPYRSSARPRLPSRSDPFDFNSPATSSPETEIFACSFFQEDANTYGFYSRAGKGVCQFVCLKQSSFKAESNNFEKLDQ